MVESEGWKGGGIFTGLGISRLAFRRRKRGKGRIRRGNILRLCCTVGVHLFCLMWLQNAGIVGIGGSNGFHRRGLGDGLWIEFPQSTRPT